MLLGYHKGLSNFFRNVFPTPMHASPGKGMPEIRDYINSGKTKYLLSVHNPRFNPYRPVFEKCRIVQIIRHPKDYIVSGYYYHKRGAEEWTKRDCDWNFIQSLAVDLSPRLSDDDMRFLDTLPSVYQLLNRFDFETGMMLEIVWRKCRQKFYPLGYFRHPNIKTFRFEDIVPDPAHAVEEICRVWQMEEDEIDAAVARAKYQSRDYEGHIRNKSAYQYETEFTPAISEFYDSQFFSLAELLGYPA